MAPALIITVGLWQAGQPIIKYQHFCIHALSLANAMFMVPTHTMKKQCQSSKHLILINLIVIYRSTAMIPSLRWEIIAL